MIHRASHLLILLVCLALVIPMLNCAPQPQLELKLNKAPRLNEPVTITCIRQTSDFVKPGQEKKVSDNIAFKKAASDNNTYDLTYEKITLQIERLDLKTRSLEDVPLKDVLVGNSLNWEADMSGEPLEFSATIKFPYEGCWNICARSTYNPRDSDCVAVQVTEDSSMSGCQKDYRPNTSHSFPITPGEQTPLAVDLDIPKPPRLDEPVQLTWSLNSIRDIDGVISEVKFYRMEGTHRVRVPVENLLIEGDLTWKGAIKKDSPINFSATVRFPQEGDWEILAIADSYAEQQPINSASVLYLHIDKDKSRWGWTEPHEEPPPPAAPENAR